MRNGNIFSIAAQLGWTASAQYKEGKLFFDFQRKTLSGVPFTFTAEMKDGKVSNLVKEIESFVDAIRTEAWLLACQLAEADGKSVLAGLPWSQWN